MLRQHFGCFVQSGRSRHSLLFPEYRASATLRRVRPSAPTFQMSPDEEHGQTLANEARHWSHSNEPRPLLPASLPKNRSFLSCLVLTSAPITREESRLSSDQTFVSPFPPRSVSRAAFHCLSPLHLSVPQCLPSWWSCIFNTRRRGKLKWMRWNYTLLYLIVNFQSIFRTKCKAMC